MSGNTELLPAIKVDHQKNEIVIHFARTLNGYRSFACPISRNGNILCPLCNTRAASIDTIIVHLNKPHTPCPHCNGAYTSLSKHIRIHDQGVASASLDKAAHDFVERQFKKGNSLYQIDKALNRAFGYFVP